MPTIPCRLGNFDCPAGSFRPRGRIYSVGPNENPIGAAFGRSGLSARLFVGFNVNNKPRWSIDDVVPIVTRVRDKQTGDPSASYLIQRGVYKHHNGKGVVQEDSAQVIVIDTTGAKLPVFREQMVKLGEEIAGKLKQESVILELQRGGVSQGSYSIVPKVTKRGR